MKIVFISSGLQSGGAEWMLFRLVKELQRSGCECEVVSLTGDGPVAKAFRKIDISVGIFDLSKRLSMLKEFWRLRRYLRESSPALVQGWMYHGNVVSSLIVKRSTPLIWGLRQSNLDAKHSALSTRFVMRLGALLSKIFTDSIVCCSDEVLRVHQQVGYEKRKLCMIPNGIDVSQFRPVASAKRDVCEELGIDPTSFLIGLFGRYHPQKDHANFLAAAAELSQTFPHCHFVLCGNAIEANNVDLTEQINRCDLKYQGESRNVTLLGSRSDMHRLTASLDLAVSASAFGEGFPNVIAEALACAVPCVTTDVGAARVLAEHHGWVVPINDSRALAHAMLSAVEASNEVRQTLGERGRLFIEENFTIERIAERYKAHYRKVCEAKSR